MNGYLALLLGQPSRSPRRRFAAMADYLRRECKADDGIKNCKVCQ